MGRTKITNNLKFLKHRIEWLYVCYCFSVSNIEKDRHFVNHRVHQTPSTNVWKSPGSADETPIHCPPPLMAGMAAV